MGMSFPAAAAVFQGEGRTPVVTEHSSSSESAPIGDRVEGILERQGGKRFKAALGGNSPVTGSPLESPDAALEVAGADVVAPGQFRVPRSVHLVWPPEMREVSQRSALSPQGLTRCYLRYSRIYAKSSRVSRAKLPSSAAPRASSPLPLRQRRRRRRSCPLWQRLSSR